MDTTTFNTHNITAMREKGDGITVIFTILFIFMTYLMSLFDEMAQHN
jgi:hypothetical protein